MVNVAIAGGTSATLGKSIVSAILATNEHEVIILSRKSNGVFSASPATKFGALVIPVDYNSPSSLAGIFTAHKIHTLISVLNTIDANEALTIHTNLLCAAQSAGLSRFILSDWSLAHPAHSRVAVLAHKADLHNLGQHHMREAGEKGEHVVECCTIQNGGFLEYFVQGCQDAELRAGLNDDLMLEYIDIANGRLAVPCVSKHPLKPARVTTTGLRDIGKYVAASLELPRGQMTGFIGIAGFTATFERIAELLNGFDLPKKVETRYVDAEECRAVAKECEKAFQEKLEVKGEFDIKLFNKIMVAQIYACDCGEEEGGGVVSGKLLNDLCPEVKPLDVGEFLKSSWVNLK